MTELESETLRIVFIAVAIILWLLIYTPLVIYNSIGYYKNRQHIVYQARYAKITIYEVVFTTLKLIYASFDNAMRLKFSDSSFISRLIDSINWLLAYLVLYCFVWRFWCISYQIIWTKYVMDNKWKSIINPQYSANNNNNNNNKTINKVDWYLKNKATYGNYKWIGKRIIFIAILSAVISMFLGSYGAKTHSMNAYAFEIIASPPYVLPFILLIIIYYQTPSFLDHFYVQTEMKYMFILLCIDYTGFYISYTMAALMDKKWTPIIINLIISAGFHLVVGAQFGAIMIATCWVNHKLKSIIKSGRYKTQKISVSEVDISNVIDIDPLTISLNPTGIITKPLMEFLCDPVGFEAFISHLSYELSMENLVSFVEFVQFQKYIADTIDLEKHKFKKQLLCHMLTLPDIVPLSVIVYDDKMNNKDKAYQLYKKYIANDSIYTINISYRVKIRITNLMKNYDIDDIESKENMNDIELMNLFDPCCNEMKQIMQDSYGRFLLTSQYQNIVNDL